MNTRLYNVLHTAHALLLDLKDKVGNTTMTTTADTVTGAVNELDADITSAQGDITTLQGDVASAQPKTMSQTIAGQTTVEGAIGALNSNLTTKGNNWDESYNWYNAGYNQNLYVSLDWKPSGVQYGATLRIKGTAEPGKSGSDTYYLCMASDGRVFAGRQLSGATAITWTQM